MTTNMNHTIYTNSNTYVNKPDINIEAFHKRLQILYPCVEDVTRLPHNLSADSKAPTLGLTQDKLSCYHRSTTGRNEDDSKVLIGAAVRADQPIPPSCLLYYFEVTCSSMGCAGAIGIGLTSVQVPVMRMPGGTKESYGYHSDGGLHMDDSVPNRRIAYGPKFEQNDVIGCGYNFVEGRCFFTRNGLNLGKAFDDIPAQLVLYPAIGLKNYGEEIQANFGQEEFVYDIEQDLRSLRKNMTLTISDYPISDFSLWQASLHKLVQSWLIENSYPETAEAFTKAAKLECKENLQRVQQRSQIQQSVLSGRIGEAIRLTDRLCPNLLKNNPNLLFALKCRQFVELISGAENDYQPIFNHANNHSTATPAKLTESNGNAQNIDQDHHQMDAPSDPELDANEEKFSKLIQYGRELAEYLQQLDKFYGKNDVNERMLQETIGLIAFTNPAASHFGKLLDPKQREPISQLLNNSIVKAERDESYRPPLEQVVDHLRKLIRLNNSHGKWLLENLIEPS